MLSWEKLSAASWQILIVALAPLKPFLSCKGFRKTKLIWSDKSIIFSDIFSQDCQMCLTHFNQIMQKKQEWTFGLMFVSLLSCWVKPCIISSTEAVESIERAKLSPATGLLQSWRRTWLICWYTSTCIVPAIKIIQFSTQTYVMSFGYQLWLTISYILKHESNSLQYQTYFYQQWLIELSVVWYPLRDVTFPACRPQPVKVPKSKVFSYNRHWIDPSDCIHYINWLKPNQTPAPTRCFHHHQRRRFVQIAGLAARSGYDALQAIVIKCWSKWSKS